MKNSGLILILLSVIVAFQSCNSDLCGFNAKHFLSTFDTFVEKIKDEDLNYNDEKWVKYDQKFTKMKEECYPKFEDKMTDEQKEEFWANSAKYYWLRYGSGFINQLLDEDSDVIENIFENLRDRWNESEEELDEVFKEVQREMENVDKDELEDLLRDIGKDVEEWGKKLEEIFEDKK